MAAMDSLHEIPIHAAPTKVFEAWTTADGLRGWWTAVAAVPGGADGEYVLSFDGGKVAFHFRVEEEVPGERVLWRGVEGPGMPGEWVGTKIDARITSGGDGHTRLQFAHRGWRSAEGFYCVCNTTWGELMYRLRDWCEGHSRGPLFGA
jgi:uncharacterized protein YndB with AHSA1/START domain